MARVGSESAPAGLSFRAAELRRLDHDRYLTALFAPAARRESLMALYAFNAEVGRIGEAVREPMMGLIRLQWWRDSIAAIYAGEPRRDALSAPLAAAVAAHSLPRALFERLLDAREQDMSADPPPSLDALVAYAQDTSATLVELAVGILGDGAGARDGATREIVRAGRSIGTAWALIGLLRAVRFHARAGRLYLPASLMQKHGLRRRDVLEQRPSAALAAVCADVAAAARAHLAEGRGVRVPRRMLSPFLLAPLGSLYLRRLERAGFDPFDPQVAQAPPWRLWRLLPPAVAGRV